jgi:hypothetical protein
MLRTYLGVALASAPALPIKAAAYIFPLVVGAFLDHHDLLDGVSLDRFASSFPSESYLRGVIQSTAAKCQVKLVRDLCGKDAFIACNKGNKKGIGHLVKMLLYLDLTTGNVVVRVLDINTSKCSRVKCANAIEVSLCRMRCPMLFKICGQSTDSGGGGVLDGLAREMAKRGLCLANYLVANCCIHNLQLQLLVPTKTVLGDGGLEKCSAMQLLLQHCSKQRDVCLLPNSCLFYCLKIMRLTNQLAPLFGA